MGGLGALAFHEEGHLTEANKALIRELYDDINRGDMHVFLEKIADDFVEHEPFPGIPPTKSGVLTLFDQLRSSFSDFRMNADAIVSEGDLVVIRGSMTGRHLSEFLGVPATGKEVRIPFCDWMRIRDGLVLEHWGVTETSALMA